MKSGKKKRQHPPKAAPGANCRASQCIREAKTVGKYEKLLLQILRGTSDANIAFDELCQLLIRLGFEERIRGSHHTFRK